MRSLRKKDRQPNEQTDRTASQGQFAQHEDAVVSTHGAAGTICAAVHEDTLVNGRIARAQPCAIYEGALVNRHSACGRSLRQADRQPNAQADGTASQGQLAQHEAAVVRAHGVGGTTCAAIHEGALVSTRNVLRELSVRRRAVCLRVWLSVCLSQAAPACAVPAHEGVLVNCARLRTRDAAVYEGVLVSQRETQNNARGLQCTLATERFDSWMSTWVY